MTAEHECCWHMTELPHGATRQRCCWCDAKRIVVPYAEPETIHGPYIYRTGARR